MLTYLLIVVMAFAAGIVQGTAGFGAGPVNMMVLPNLFPVNQAAAVNGCICGMLDLMMLLHYRKFIKWKKVLIPAILYVGIAGVAINFSTMIDQNLMKRIFGCFLIVLAIYYLFFSKGTKKAMSLPVSILCICISGICDGLFGIGGPLMVLYFLNKTDSKEEYLGTIQSLFLLSIAYGTVIRVYKGILQPVHVPYIVIGMISIFFASLITPKIVDRIDIEKLKKIIYILIGITGIINVF